MNTSERKTTVKFDYARFTPKLEHITDQSMVIEYTRSIPVATAAVMEKLGLTANTGAVFNVRVKNPKSERKAYVQSDIYQHALDAYDSPEKAKAFAEKLSEPCKVFAVQMWKYSGIALMERRNDNNNMYYAAAVYTNPKAGERKSGNDFYRLTLETVTGDAFHDGNPERGTLEPFDHSIEWDSVHDKPVAWYGFSRTMNKLWVVVSLEELESCRYTVYKAKDTEEESSED